jgi:hypothetical protein
MSMGWLTNFIQLIYNSDSKFTCFERWFPSVLGIRTPMFTSGKDSFIRIMKNQLHSLTYINTSSGDLPNKL